MPYPCSPAGGGGPGPVHVALVVVVGICCCLFCAACCAVGRWRRGQLTLEREALDSYELGSGGQAPGAPAAGWAAVERAALVRAAGAGAATKEEMTKVQDLLLLFSERLQILEESLQQLAEGQDTAGDLEEDRGRRSKRPR